MKKLNTIFKIISLFLLTFLCINHTIQAQTVISNPLVFENAVASYTYSPEQGPGATIDGILGQRATRSGWYVPNTNSERPTISWDLTDHAPTLTPDQTVDFYTYTIELHIGYTEKYSFKEYSLLANNNLITDYTDLTANFNNITLFNNGGTITSSDPETFGSGDIYASFSHTFTSESIVSTLQLNVDQGWWWNNGTILLSEITGTGSATVVPEPSTYALLIGLFAFVFITYRKARASQRA